MFYVGLFAVTYRKCTKSQYKVADASLLYGATRFQSLVAVGDHLTFLLPLIILARHFVTLGSDSIFVS